MRAKLKFSHTSGGSILNLSDNVHFPYTNFTTNFRLNMSAQGRQVHTTHFVSSVHFVKLAILSVKIPDTKQQLKRIKKEPLGSLMLYVFL